MQRSLDVSDKLAGLQVTRGASGTRGFQSQRPHLVIPPGEPGAKFSRGEVLGPAELLVPLLNQLDSLGHDLLLPGDRGSLSSLGTPDVRLHHRDLLTQLSLRRRGLPAKRVGLLRNLRRFHICRLPVCRQLRLRHPRALLRHLHPSLELVAQSDNLPSERLDLLVVRRGCCGRGHAVFVQFPPSRRFGSPGGGALSPDPEHLPGGSLPLVLLRVRRARLRPFLRGSSLRELGAKFRHRRRVADVVVEDDSGRLRLNLSLDGPLNLGASHLRLLRPSQRLFFPLRQRPHERLGSLVLGVLSRRVAERDAGPLSALGGESFSLFQASLPFLRVRLGLLALNLGAGDLVLSPGDPRLQPRQLSLVRRRDAGYLSRGVHPLLHQRRLGVHRGGRGPGGINGGLPRSSLHASLRRGGLLLRRRGLELGGRSLLLGDGHLLARRRQFTLKLLDHPVVHDGRRRRRGGMDRLNRRPLCVEARR